MVNEDTAGDESDLHRAVESLLRSRPDLADPNRLRRFEEMLKRKIATLDSTGDPALPDLASSTDKPRKLTPEEKLMWFAVHSGGSAVPAILILATFPRFPLPILPVIVILSFFVTRYLFRAEFAGSRPIGKG